MSIPLEAPTRPRTEGLAIASLALAVLSMVLGPFGWIPAIIFGHMARARIRRDPALGGSGLALAGLIIGYVLAVLTVLTVIVFFSFIAIIGDQPPSFEAN